MTGPCPTAAGKPCAEPPYPSGAVETYNPETRKWTKGRPLSVPRWGLCVSAQDGAIYAIGGYAANPKGVDETWPDGFGLASRRDREVYAVPTTVMEVLNPSESDGWTRKTNMEVTRAFASSAVLPYDQQGVVFVTGGRNTTSPAMTSMAAYFPKNNSWVRHTHHKQAASEIRLPVTSRSIADRLRLLQVEKAPMPVGRASHSSVVVAGKLYVLGGRTGPAKTPLRTVDAYDPRLNTWVTNVAAIPVSNPPLVVMYTPVHSSAYFWVGFERLLVVVGYGTGWKAEWSVAGGCGGAERCDSSAGR